MKIVSVLNSCDLVLFKCCKGKFGHEGLRSFINFLRYQGQRGPIRFSYSSNDGQLHNKLSLRENIILESIPLRIQSDDSICLQSYVAERGNLALTELLLKISDIELAPNKATDQDIKIASLCQTLLRDTKYLFFDHPESFLTKEQTDLFYEALMWNLTKYGQVAFLNSKDHAYWDSKVKKVVTRQDQHYTLSTSTTIVPEPEILIEKVA